MAKWIVLGPNQINFAQVAKTTLREIQFWFWELGNLDHCFWVEKLVILPFWMDTQPCLENKDKVSNLMPNLQKLQLIWNWKLDTGFIEW